MAISLTAGLATVVGAFLTLLVGRSTRRILAGILGFAAGIMLGVVVLDLLPSAWRLGGPLPFALGAVSGWGLIWLASRFWSGPQQRQGDGSPVSTSLSLVKLGYLVATGIAFHDLPEGIAIAAGYAAAPELGWLIALAIGLHNIPEGMAMAAPMVLGGQSAGRILATAALVSLVTPFGAFLGLLLVTITPHLIAYLLAFAGGTMSYIVIGELWPEGKNQGPRWAALGAVCGWLLIIVLTFLE